MTSAPVVSSSVFSTAKLNLGERPWKGSRSLLEASVWHVSAGQATAWHSQTFSHSPWPETQDMTHVKGARARSVRSCLTSWTWPPAAASINTVTPVLASNSTLTAYLSELSPTRAKIGAGWPVSCLCLGARAF